MVYVMSDLHGAKDRYDAMLKQISFGGEDTLYILGDVIDRGKFGVEILQDMMARRNAVLVKGNHEKMLLDVYESRLKASHEDDLALWNWNGGLPTLKTLYYGISPQERDALILYLREAPLFLETEAGGNRWYLVHGCPAAAAPDGSPADENAYVWQRVQPDVCYFKDKTVVFGHTPTSEYQTGRPLRIWHGQNNSIGIDCGCAMLGYGGRLGCLCLDNMQEFYV